MMTAPTMTDDELDAQAMDLLNDPGERFHARLHDLRDLADDYRDLTRRLVILEGQLGEKGRGTLEARKRACERRDDWKRQLTRLDDESHTLRLVLASQWHKLPVKTKRQIANHPEWPSETVAPRLVMALWRALQRGERPEWLCPF